MNFVLDPNMINPFYKIKIYLTFNELFKYKGEKTLTRTRELFIILVVYLIYNLIIDRKKKDINTTDAQRKRRMGG